MKYLFLITIILPCLIACGTTQTKDAKSQIPNKSQAPPASDKFNISGIPMYRENPNILNPELEARIIQLVKDLDDNNQKRRINATEELIKIGEPALEDVKKALIKPPNNEIGRAPV